MKIIQSYEEKNNVTLGIVIEMKKIFDEKTSEPRERK